MATRIQVTIDCADADRLARFWALALRYVPQDPPAGFNTWRDYYRSVGVPEEELDDGIDRIADPDGVGPGLWFQQVPEPKTVKNRVHLDLDASGGRTVPLPVRKERVDAEVERLVAAGASVMYALDEDFQDHYAVVLQDPERNEFCVH